VLGRDSASKPSHARVWNPRLLVWEDQSLYQRSVGDGDQERRHPVGRVGKRGS
jgi:hypothetical protein